MPKQLIRLMELQLSSYYITAIVCIITALVIQRIYHQEKNRTSFKSTIYGIKWFALAILVWGVGAVANIVLTHIVKTDNHLIIASVGVLVSLMNSLFILLSIPSIQHGEKRSLVIKIIERFSIKEVFVLFMSILVMIASVFLLSYFRGSQQSEHSSIFWLVDIPFSIVVALALLQELNKAFKKRGMPFMRLPTYTLFLLIIIAVTHRIIPFYSISQWIELHNWQLIGIISQVSFKFLFILLFMILLYSWKLLAEKEEQESELKKIESQNRLLLQQNETLEIANESHIDTIKRLKENVKLREEKYQKLKEDSAVVLSNRQKEVLANLALCGVKKSYNEIADTMHISIDGFQTHIYQIKKLLNISGSDGKEQLINYAKNNQLLPFATISNDEK